MSTGNIYYCALKNHKSIFHHNDLGNTHLFFIPVSENTYFYLGLLGKEVNTKNYISTLIVRLPAEVVENFIQEETDFFKERFNIIESVKCNVKKKELGNNYSISIIGNSKYIPHSFNLIFDGNHSSVKKRIYRMVGDFNFFMEELNNEDKKIISIKANNLKHKMMTNDEEIIHTESSLLNITDEQGKIIMNSRQLMELAIRDYLFDEYKSKINNMSLAGSIQLENHINNLSLEKGIKLIFEQDYKDQETKKDKRWKYGAAGGVGAVTGAGISYKNNLKDAYKQYKSTSKKWGDIYKHNEEIKDAAKEAKKEVDKNLLKTEPHEYLSFKRYGARIEDFKKSFRNQKRPSGLKTAALMAIGTMAAIGAFALYRKYTSPCHKQAKIMFPFVKSKRLEYVKKCQLESVEKIIMKLKSDLGRCSQDASPSNCQAKINKQISKWQAKANSLKY